MNLWREIYPPKLGSGRCRISFRICLTLVMGGQSLTRNSFLKKNIDKSRRLSTPKIYNYIISGMNRVPMARHGLILRENEATGSRKVFKYLPGLRDTIKLKKYCQSPKNPKTPYFPPAPCAGIAT